MGYFHLQHKQIHPGEIHPCIIFPVQPSFLYSNFYQLFMFRFRHFNLLIYFPGCGRWGEKSTSLAFRSCRVVFPPFLNFPAIIVVTSYNLWVHHKFIKYPNDDEQHFMFQYLFGYSTFMYLMNIADVSANSFVDFYQFMTFLALIKNFKLCKICFVDSNFNPVFLHFIQFLSLQSCNLNQFFYDIQSFDWQSNYLFEC